MLSKEQIAQIKEQLFKQLENWPESQRETAKKQIQEMDEEELEKFLIKNKLIKASGQEAPCVFCSIIKGETQSYKIAENEKAVAVLEINPISKAHAIIIPKQHIKAEQLSTQEFSLAQEVSQKIKRIFNTKKIEISTSELFEHALINVLPVYKNENINSKREKADEKELKEIQKQLSIEKKPKIPEEKKQPEKLRKAPKRIP